MSTSELPQKTEGLRSVVALLGFALDAVPYASAVLKELQDHRIEDGRRILLEQVKASGLSTIENLTPGQADFFLPSTYRFLEQVRLGEYAYNLSVLGRLIAHEMKTAEIGDVGKIARAARYLEMAKANELLCLAACPRAMEIHRLDANGHAGHDGLLTPNNIRMALSESKTPLSQEDVIEAVDSLVWRNLLAADRTIIPGDELATLTYRTTGAFHEIIGACRGTVAP